MSKLIWDAVGQRFYETGVNQGVLYKQNSAGLYPLGVAWNGLTGVSESPSGAEATPIYADNIKYLNLISAEEYGATLEAYTYPDEFAECDGSGELATGVIIGQQPRKAFGLSFRTVLGNDVDGTDLGYKLHLIYGAMAAPSEKAYATVNDSPEAITFSWEITTTPVSVTGMKPTASLVVDSTKVSSAALATLEDILYGTEVADARLPLPDEVMSLFAGEAPAAIEMSSIVPTDDDTDIAINSDIVLTFNNEISAEEVTVAAEDGTLVEGTKAFDATGKVLTFTPAGDLSTSTMYLVTIAGVVDVYGQGLATSVTNFMTVA